MGVKWTSNIRNKSVKWVLKWGNECYNMSMSVIKGNAVKCK